MKAKASRGEPNIFAQADYCHLRNEELGTCIAVRDWWVTVCELALGTRPVKYNPNIYCELNMMLGEIFVKDQHLLLAEKRLWWHKADFLLKYNQLWI